MLRWFFDAQDASPLEILSLVPHESFAVAAGDVPIESEFAPAPEAPTLPLLALTNSGDDVQSEAVLRWRRVVLSLSDEFSGAAQRHPTLAPIFMEAMGNLLEQLLLFGREEDILALDEWLHFRPPAR